MKKELEDLLSDYLGHLLHKQETTFDWIEKDRVIEKINAVCVLLDMPCKVQTWYEKVSEEIKKTIR